ncbi:MAG TPA: suppressor of fused domain protein [Anaerolineae bacterium]|nr:suppressor of fused domain protein [Anaerolineae bacterium]
MNTTSIEDKAIATRVREVFGGTAEVHRYWDEGNEFHVDILHSANSPWPGVTSYSTLGLSNWPLFQDDKEFKVRLELVGACTSNAPTLGNVLATCAFYIIKERWFCAPGVIFRDMLTINDVPCTTPHLLFVPPFLWDEKLNTTFQLANRLVTWLLAVPITEAEAVFGATEGSDKLENLLQEKDVAIFDLQRKSVA